MGSRSKTGRRTKGSRKSKLMTTDFWRDILTAIESREEGALLSWKDRALLYTRCTLRLPNLCKLHGLGCPDGYIDVIKRLVEGKKLEFFDRDALKRIKKLLREIIRTAGDMRMASIDSVVC